MTSSDHYPLRQSDTSQDSGPHPPTSQEIVLLWEPLGTRAEVIKALIDDAGGYARRIEDLSDILTSSRSPKACVLVVSVREIEPTDNSQLDIFRNLTQKGVAIYAYAQNSHTWPLTKRCQFHLAGVKRLFDSAAEEFTSELRQAVKQAVRAEMMRLSRDVQHRQVIKKCGIVGESPPMLDVFEWIVRVAPLSDLPVLITGETGTGKQLVAEAIHRLDPKRSAAPLITINCAAINPGLAETELFGHRRGAFTGAERDRRGLIRSAQGGTLFLDEIGELKEDLQAKLLRVLQEGRVLQVGEDHEVPVDIRIIAATNRDLGAMTRTKVFREDLLHRLNVLSIQLPSLRQRLDDYPLLINHFLKKHRSLTQDVVLLLNSDFVEALRTLPLLGNVRELENLIRRTLINKTDMSPLCLSDLPADLLEYLSNSPRSTPHVLEPSTVEPQQAEALQSHLAQHDLFILLKRNGWNLSRSLYECEKSFLQAALRATNGNQTAVARRLGITPRSVYNKIRKHQLNQ